MFARKISKITIQSNVHEFYEIKDFFLTKKKCMICKKKKTLTITETNRTLTVVCTTPGCKGNMTIPVGTFITYDALYAIRKTNYMNSVNARQTQLCDGQEMDYVVLTSWPYSSCLPS